MITEKSYIEIDGKKIGPAHKPYIIAELSANHNGDLAAALKTIEVAKACGADAIKIQTYTPDTMTIKSDKEDFQVRGGLWDGYQLYDLYQWAHTPFEWHQALFEKAKQVGITLFSTPFDETAVDLLESLNTPAYKIASFEITDLPLIERVAKTGKPMIMSTGMANQEEIAEAIATARAAGCNDLVVLHCISAYPAPYQQANLATINDISARYDVLSGLSDHTLGTTVSVAAVALGACLIEKHFILDRTQPGPDSTFSIEPQELKSLVQNTEIAHQAIGKANYDLKQAEQSSIKFRRSIYFVKPLKAGDIIKAQDIRRIRPGYGLAPKHFEQLIGMKVNKDIDAGTAASWRDIEKAE